MGSLTCFRWFDACKNLTETSRPAAGRYTGVSPDFKLVPSRDRSKAEACCSASRYTRSTFPKHCQKGIEPRCKGNGCRRGAGEAAAGDCLQMRQSGKLMLHRQGSRHVNKHLFWTLHTVM
jgi:hypothetical protein